MITIATEQPPSSLDPEVQEYIQRILISVAGALLEAETEIESLKKRVAILESKVP